MADPGTIGLVAKAAITALSDERVRKGVGWVIVAILSPFILSIVIICGLLSGASNHNNTAIDLSFHGGATGKTIPSDYRGHIEDMQKSFLMLDRKIKEVESQMEEEDSLDHIMVKAIFYSLYFASIQPSEEDLEGYVDCFVTYEERIRMITDDEGNAIEETYIVAIPIESLVDIYKRIENIMGKEITYEDMANANEIYHRIRYGTKAPIEGDEFLEWRDWRHSITPEELKELYHDLPVGEKGSEIVKLAMSRLGDPYSQEKRGRVNYTDCSHLTMWSYKQIGITIPATASEQGRFCANNNLTVSKDDLVSGDLVFWSHKPNGKFMNITHVGVYVGDGKVVDASYSRREVVYRNLFDLDKIVLYGRPHILK